MSLTRILVLFGSNVEPEVNAVTAARKLAAVIDRIQISSAWHSSALGCEDSPEFINWAAVGKTRLGPVEFKFDVLRPIEEELGRHRSSDINAPRTADLDLLLYGDLVLSDANAGLELPDPDLQQHAHALIPAAEIAPDIVVPGSNRTLGEQAEEVDARDLRPLGPVLELTRK